jgi:Tfp pilus assembly protein PilX
MIPGDRHAAVRRVALLAFAMIAAWACVSSAESKCEAACDDDAMRACVGYDEATCVAHCREATRGSVDCTVTPQPCSVGPNVISYDCWGLP